MSIIERLFFGILGASSFTLACYVIANVGNAAVNSASVADWTLRFGMLLMAFIGALFVSVASLATKQGVDKL